MSPLLIQIFGGGFAPSLEAEVFCCFLGGGGMQDRSWADGSNATILAIPQAWVPRACADIVTSILQGVVMFDTG